MRRRVGGLAALTALVVTACGGSDGSDEGAEVTPAPIEATTTVEVASPSTGPPPTDAATTTEATTATTLAPTTTIDPAIALADEVEKDYREGWQRLRVAQQNPMDAARERRALRYYSGSSGDSVVASLADFRDRRLRILEDTPTDPTITIEAGPDLISEETATLVACVVDPWILVETGGAPDGSDAIVDDAVYAYRNEVGLRLRDGIWTTEQSTQVGEWTGGRECLGP